MPSLSIARAQNAKLKEAIRQPVTALFIGGTSGIGQNIAFKLASNVASPHIVVSGRNAQSGEATVARLREINQEGKYEFQPIDVSLMGNVKDFVKDFSSRNQKLNYLVISSGFLSTAARTETKDGIDNKLAINYYGRFSLIFRLLPLLERAAEQGEEARVMTVLACARGGPVPVDDLDLKKRYGLKAAATVASTYNDLMVEEFAHRSPKVSFMHAYPGMVDTNIASGLPWYLRGPAKLLSVFARNPADTGDYLLYGLTNPESKVGWHLIDENGDKVKPCAYQTEQSRKTVWDHTLKLTKLDQP